MSSDDTRDDTPHPDALDDPEYEDTTMELSLQDVFAIQRDDARDDEDAPYRAPTRERGAVPEETAPSIDARGVVHTPRADGTTEDDEAAQTISTSVIAPDDDLLEVARRGWEQAQDADAGEAATAPVSRDAVLRQADAAQGESPDETGHFEIPASLLEAAKQTQDPDATAEFDPSVMRLQAAAEDPPSARRACRARSSPTWMLRGD